MQATLSSKTFLRESFLPALSANAFAEFAQNLLHGTSTLTFVSCVPAVHSAPRLAFRPVPCPQEIAGLPEPGCAQVSPPSFDRFLPRHQEPFSVVRDHVPLRPCRGSATKSLRTDAPFAWKSP